MARLVWLDALGEVRPGQRVALGVERRGAEYCLAVDRERSCGHGFTAADGWRLISLPDRELVPWQPSLSLLWLAGLCAPLGYWGRRDLLTAAGCLLVAAALALAPAAGALLPTPARCFAGAALGVLAGAGIRALIARPGAR
jgi:hypothetical protein